MMILEQAKIRTMDAWSIGIEDMSGDRTEVGSKMNGTLYYEQSAMRRFDSSDTKHFNI